MWYRSMAAIVLLISASWAYAQSGPPNQGGSSTSVYFRAETTPILSGEYQNQAGSNISTNHYAIDMINSSHLETHFDSSGGIHTVTNSDYYTSPGILRNSEYSKTIRIRFRVEVSIYMSSRITNLQFKVNGQNASYVEQGVIVGSDNANDNVYGQDYVAQQDGTLNIEVFSNGQLIRSHSLNPYRPKIAFSAEPVRNAKGWTNQNYTLSLAPHTSNFYPSTSLTLNSVPVGTTTPSYSVTESTTDPLTFVLTDQEGISSGNVVYSPKIDTTAPIVSDTGNVYSNWKNKSSSNLTWNFTIVDSKSFVKLTPNSPSDALLSKYRVLFLPPGQGALDPSANGTTLATGTLNGSNASSVNKSVSYSVETGQKKSGYYYLETTTLDVADNENIRSLGPYLYDREPPEPVTPPTLSLQSATVDGKTVVTGIVANWSTPIDDLSGVAGYKVYLDVGFGFIANPSIVSQSDAHTLTFPIALFSRPTTVRVAVIATDLAGNELLVSDPSIQPATASLVSTLTSLDALSIVNDAQDNSVVRITLGRTGSQVFQDYDAIELLRIVGDSIAPISTQTLRFTRSDLFFPNGNLRPGTGWSLDSDQRPVFADTIDKHNRWGNKTVRYAVSSQFSGLALNEFGNVTSPVRLPNHKGTPALTILDMDGHAFGSPDFHVYSDGKIQIAMTASDVDADDWLWEVDSVKQVAGFEGLTSYASLSGKNPLPVSWNAPSGAYPNSSAVVTLKVGVNNVCLTWLEAGSFGPFRSDVTSIELISDGMGGFTIVVTDEYNNAAQGSDGTITVFPGQPLTLTASGGAQAFGLSWDFGDGSNEETSASVTHRYHQDPARTGDRSTYTLTLTVQSFPVVHLPLQVVVLDTSEGELYENETWLADHEVTGKITIPAGVSLNIPNAATIRFVGGLGAGYDQGLRVQGGSLNVGPGVVFKRDEAQSQLWSGIVVDGGSASFSGVRIERAVRGIAAGRGANVTVNASTIADGEIGVHVLHATSVVSISNSTIENQSLDAVKEDDGGRPSVTNSILRNNLEAYYSETSGPLTVAEVNALPGNSGNQE